MSDDYDCSGANLDARLESTTRSGIGQDPELKPGWFILKAIGFHGRCTPAVVAADSGLGFVQVEMDHLRSLHLKAVGRALHYLSGVAAGGEIEFGQAQDAEPPAGVVAEAEPAQLTALAVLLGT